MRTPLSLLGVAAFVSLLMVGMTGSAQVLLDDDFSSYQEGDALASPWVVEEGEARVVEDGLLLRNSGTDAFALRGVAAGDGDWADYRVDIEARLEKAGEDWRDGLWIGVRYAHGVNAYRIGMREPAVDKPFEPLEHGLAIEFPIFYRQAELLDLRLNGRLIEEDNLDGYQVWYDRHDQQIRVRVNVPAEKANRLKVLIVSTHYRPDRQRVYTFEPPAGVKAP